MRKSLLLLPLGLSLSAAPAVAEAWITVHAWPDDDGVHRTYQVDLDSIRWHGDEIYVAQRMLWDGDAIKNSRHIKVNCSKNELTEQHPKYNWGNPWVRQPNGHWHFRDYAIYGGGYTRFLGLPKDKKPTYDQEISQRRIEAVKSAKFDFLCKAKKP